METVFGIETFTDDYVPNDPENHIATTVGVNL
jgi:hypothetical protein